MNLTYNIKFWSLKNIHILESLVQRILSSEAALNLGLPFWLALHFHFYYLTFFLLDVEEFINLFDVYAFKVQTFIHHQINNIITNPGGQTKADPTGRQGPTTEYFLKP